MDYPEEIFEADEAFSAPETVEEAQPFVPVDYTVSGEVMREDATEPRLLSLGMMEES